MTNGANREQRRRYKRAKVVALSFADPEMHGLEVRTRRVTFDTAMDLIEMAEDLDKAGGLGDREQIEKFLLMFADEVLLSWNLDEDILDEEGNETGEVRPVPPTLEGLKSQDVAFVMEIFQSWQTEVVGVAAPLGATSPAGPPSEAPPLPMEPLSPSPEN